MRVRELMRREWELVTVEPEATVRRAVDLLMRHRIGALPVTGPEGAPLGLLAERDIVRALAGGGDGVLERTVSQVMRQPPPLCDADDALTDVMARMTRRRLRHLVVCDGGRMVGVLSVGDLVKHRLDQLETEAGVLRDYVAGQRARA